MSPFQPLLYCCAAQSGYAVVTTVSFESLASVDWKDRSVILCIGSLRFYWVVSVRLKLKSVFL